MKIDQLPIGANLLFYDSVCGLCNRGIQFLLRYDRNRDFYFVPLQSTIAQRVLFAAGKDPGRMDSFYLLTHYGTPDEQLLSKASATLFIAEKLGGIFALLAQGLKLLPLHWLDHGYTAIANSRYRFFGTTDHCYLSRQFQDRFVNE